MQPYRPSFSPRRALIAGVTGLMLLVLQTAANAATQAPPTIAAGTLTIGSDLTYPPYAFMDGETPAGLDPDFMKTLASHLQLKPLFVDTRFANLILGVNAKRIDVIASAVTDVVIRTRTVSLNLLFLSVRKLCRNGWRVWVKTV